MSKRFGRNQRRRAREALAVSQQELNAAYERLKNVHEAMALDRALLRRQRAELTEADQYARSIARIVGRTAIIAGELVTDDLKWDIQRQGAKINVMPAATPCYVDFRSPPMAMSLSQVRHETLELLDIDVVLSDISRCMHMHVTLANQTVGYAIGDHALYLLSEHELEARIAPEISQLLVRKIKSKYRLRKGA